MRTRLGQWFAGNVPVFSHLWEAEIAAALWRQAECRAHYERAELLRELNCWAAASFTWPKESTLITAWVRWRNAADQEHRAREKCAGCRLELPIELQGLPRFDDEQGFRKLFGLEGEPKA